MSERETDYRPEEERRQTPANEAWRIEETDTGFVLFNQKPEKTTLDNRPVWLYQNERRRTFSDGSTRTEAKAVIPVLRFVTEFGSNGSVLEDQTVETLFEHNPTAPIEARWLGGTKYYEGRFILPPEGEHKRVLGQLTSHPTQPEQYYFQHTGSNNHVPVRGIVDRYFNPLLPFAINQYLNSPRPIEVDLYIPKNGGEPTLRLLEPVQEREASSNKLNDFII